MREETRTFLRFSLRALLLLGVPVLCVVFAPLFWRLFSPFALALCVAAPLQPVIRFFRRRLKFGGKTAVVITLFLLCALLLLLVYWFFSFAVAQLLSALSNAPDIISGITAALQALGERLLSSLEHVPTTVAEWLRTSFSNAAKWLYDQGVSLAGDIVSGTFSFALRLPDAFIYLNFLFLSVCFLTMDYDQYKARYLKRGAPGAGDRLRASAVAGTVGFLRVQLVYAVFVFVVSWLYFQSFGFQYSVLLAGFAALLEFLPIFGNGTFYIPWLVVCFFLGETRTAVLILILHLALYLTRKLTEPRLINRNMGLTPMTSLIVMFVGLRLGGVLGLTLSPIIGVVVVSAWRGGLFTSAIADGREVIRNVRRCLAPRDDQSKTERKTTGDDN